MEDVIKVAEYTLWYCENELHNPISNLQLQKFLYYEQGIHLALAKEPLFETEIQAWQYGPVVPDVYYWFNSNNSNKITGAKNYSDDISKNAVIVIEFVARELINISPWNLVEKTHKEDPWKEIYISGFNEKIPNEIIKEYFEKEYLKRN